MAEILLFHHVGGLTSGVLDLARTLESWGHTVHAPDLFAGVQPTDLQAGMALVDALGERALSRQVEQLASRLPSDVVYAGISWGAMQAQRLAQQRPGARGALLLEGFIDVEADWSFGPWPADVPAQIHGMDEDPFFAHEGDLAAARNFVQRSGQNLAQLFTYPGAAHLFTDSSLPSYDPEAFRLLTHRVRDFLDNIDRATPRNSSHR